MITAFSRIGCLLIHKNCTRNASIDHFIVITRLIPECTFVYNQLLVKCKVNVFPISNVFCCFKVVIYMYNKKAIGDSKKNFLLF